MNKINKFEILPIELKRKIILENTHYYQQKLVDLLIKYDKNIILCDDKKELLKFYKRPLGEINYYLYIYENENNNFTKEQIKSAYKRLTNVLMPMIKKLKDEIKICNINNKNYKKEIDNFRSQYYYYYNLLKKM